MNRCLVIGLSGVTCGGKSAAAGLLRKAFPWSRTLMQDEYFLPESSEKHVWLLQPRHVNWEQLSALDMDSMWLKVQQTTNDLNRRLTKMRQRTSTTESDAKNGSLSFESLDIPPEVSSDTETLSLIKAIHRHHLYHPILLIDGFMIFDHTPITQLCDLKFFFTLTKEQCRQRRSGRVYQPPDPAGYFDACVWPMHMAHRRRVESTVADVNYIDGMVSNGAALRRIVRTIKQKLDSAGGSSGGGEVEWTDSDDNSKNSGTRHEASA